MLFKILGLQCNHFFLQKSIKGAFLPIKSIVNKNNTTFYRRSTSIYKTFTTYSKIYI